MNHNALSPPPPTSRLCAARILAMGASQRHAQGSHGVKSPERQASSASHTQRTRTSARVRDRSPVRKAKEREEAGPGPERAERAAPYSDAGGGGGSAGGQRAERKENPFSRIPSGSVYEEAEAGKGGENGAVQGPRAAGSMRRSGSAQDIRKEDSQSSARQRIERLGDRSGR